MRNRFLTFGIFSFTCALALSLTNCGGGGSSPAPPPTQNPVPGIISISPTSATAGAAAFTLTVNGSNFISGSKVRWGSTSKSTSYVSSTQLTAAITVNDIASAATVAVTVFNPAPGGGTSNSVNFTINAANNPVPTLTSLSPPSGVAGGAAFSLTVTGTNFVSNSVVRWNGADRSTTFQSSTQLTASITAADIASAASMFSIGTTRLPDGASGKPYDFTLAVTGGTAHVSVFNPTPGGGLSSPVTFDITTGVPPYSWSVTSGNLPTGLSLAASGEISGTAATVGSDTTANFTVHVSDSAAQPHAATHSLSILVHAGALGRNDTCSASTATKISNGVIRASISPSISPYGDVDVYSFEGTAGSKVTIEIYAQRLDIYGDGADDRDVYLDSFLEILNSSCSQIAFNDDIDLGVMQDSLIQDYVLPATGTYYIRVSDLGGGGRPDFIYDLHLSGAN